MDDDAAKGCAVIMTILLAAPFFIAACPILAGIAAGSFFSFVILPLIVWWILRIFGIK